MANNDITDVIHEVVAERNKQQSYGFDTTHDDKYERDELLRAGICYAAKAGEKRPKEWPWDYSWWKPRNHRYNLIRAIALLVAYVESTDRRNGRKDW